MDFGMTKRIPIERIEREKSVNRAGLEGDAARVSAELAQLGFVAADDPAIDSDGLLAYVRSFHEWHAEDRPFRLTGRLREQADRERRSRATGSCRSA
jgi:hypothetical protein